jgi:peptide/nickel transport system permease protein
LTRLILAAFLITPGLALVILGIFWIPYSPTTVTDLPFSPPSLSHPFGTDWFGRDVLSRVMVGGRASWAVATFSIGASSLLGTALGLGAGYFRGILETILLQISNGILAFPSILLALVLAVVLGRGLTGVTLALTLFNLPYFLRLAHAGTLSLKRQDFILASISAGAGPLHVLLRHILPNLASPLLVQATFALGTTLLAEASLSYLGLGLQPPNPSWGRMLWEAQSWLGQSFWPAFFPGLVLFSAVLGLNILGDLLRDLLDPRFRPILNPSRPPQGAGHKAG